MSRIRWAIALTLAVVLLVGCGLGDEESAAPPADPLDAKLADSFRIDVSELDLTYDYRPSAERVRGTALLRFEMRPGETRPLFHFNPLREATREQERRMLRSVTLDGERLDPGDDEDLRQIRPRPSAEPALELQRDLSEADAHTLRVTWAMPNGLPQAGRGWFYTNFDDTIGRDVQSETLWPTVSSPEELARHRVRLRVHSGRPYTVLGSGGARKRATGGTQTWDMDAGRPIASHTVFLAALPSDQVRTARFDASGVAVRIVSTRSAEILKRASETTRTTIERLVDALGPFPMPRMEILLTDWGSGMEFWGATRTGLGALEHELMHMYFGAATVNRTWRDTWIDEAAVSWVEGRDHHSFELKPGFESDMAGGSSPIAVGFDTSAYGAGAKVFGEIAQSLGGDRQMVEFLADLHRRRAYKPFTTDQLIDDVVAAQDEIDREQLERWLFTKPDKRR